MTDQQPTTALATRPVREVRVVEDIIPILDTARFEQMQRIASAMAKGSLIPATLRGEYTGSGNARTLQPFEPEVVVANVFRVVNQAVRWNMDPFAVIDCASVVHGRLMWEGKLVHAVVEARVGVRLNYRFGKMVSGQFDGSEEGKGEDLAIQVFGKFDDEDDERTIEGTVAQWKTTGTNSPWGSPANWKRQLRYRGSREWARAHSSAVMLGVVTDDEMDADAAREVQVSSARARRTPGEKADLRGKLTGPQEGQAGFDPAHVQRESGGAPAAEEETPHDPATGEVIEATATEVAEPTEDAAAETEDAGTRPATDEEQEDALETLRLNAYEDGMAGEPVQAALAECETDEERELVAKAHAEGVQARIEKDAAEHQADAPPADEPKSDLEWTFETVGGAAPKGEVYLLTTDEPSEKGRLPTYQDGKPHSSVGTKGAAALKAYDGHPEPADPALASQGGGTGQAPTRSPLFNELAGMASWLQVKPRLGQVYNEDDFKALEPEDQIRVRAGLWPAVIEMKERTKDPVDWVSDVSAFVLWQDFTALSGDPDAADMIDGTFQTLQSSAAWEKLTDPQKQTIETRVSAHLHRLRSA